jgi:hypothetical protein
MTGAWRLKSNVIPKPALQQVRELRFTQKISFKKFPLYIRDDRCMAFKKQCHPETCPSAGEGPSEGVALQQVRELRFTQKISFKKFPLYVRDDRCMAFKKPCHPETCPSAGEGPSEGVALPQVRDLPQVRALPQVRELRFLRHRCA